MTTWHVLNATIKREWLVHVRHPMTILTPIAFFILTVLLFPLAITSDPVKLQAIGPGVIWVAILLANLLCLETLFYVDYEDGTLEQMALNPGNFTSQIFSKLILQWLIATLPLLLIATLLSKVFYISNHAVIVLIASVLLGSPSLSFVGAVGAALTLGLANRGMLLVLLTLPLYLPVLIFGAGAVNDAMLNLPVLSELAFLAAILVLALTFIPWVVAAALRLTLE